MATWVFDIDGTLGNFDHRRHYVQRLRTHADGNSTYEMREDPDWKTFLSPEEVLKDRPIPEAQEALRRIRDFGGRFAFFTGRTESKLRATTEEWLRRHYIREGEILRLWMRTPEYEGRPPGEFKSAVMHGASGRAGLKTFKAIWGIPEWLAAEVDVGGVVFVDDDLVTLREVRRACHCTTLKAPECWPFVCPMAEGDDRAWRI